MIILHMCDSLRWISASAIAVYSVKQCEWKKWTDLSPSTLAVTSFLLFLSHSSMPTWSQRQRVGKPEASHLDCTACIASQVQGCCVCSALPHPSTHFCLPSHPKQACVSTCEPINPPRSLLWIWAAARRCSTASCSAAMERRDGCRLWIQTNKECAIFHLCTAQSVNRCLLTGLGICPTDDKTILENTEDWNELWLNNVALHTSVLAF